MGSPLPLPLRPFSAQPGGEAAAAAAATGREPGTGQSAASKVGGLGGPSSLCAGEALLLSLPTIAPVQERR